MECAYHTALLHSDQCLSNKCWSYFSNTQSVLSIISGHRPVWKQELCTDRIDINAHLGTDPLSRGQILEFLTVTSWL